MKAHIGFEAAHHSRTRWQQGCPSQWSEASNAAALWYKASISRIACAAKHCKLKVMRMHAAEKVCHANSRDVGATAGVAPGNDWHSVDG